MARATGIGCFFFRAAHPAALNRWYADHFGVVMPESKSYDEPHAEVKLFPSATCGCSSQRQTDLCSPLDASS